MIHSCVGMNVWIEEENFWSSGPAFLLFSSHEKRNGFKSGGKPIAT